MSIEPFTVDVPSDVLDDLHVRLRHTRWPDSPPGAGWQYGTDGAYLRELTRYWIDEFDWRAQEAATNRLNHYVTTVEGMRVHFVHERGVGPDPLPLVLVHGWPDSFLRMSKVLPLLTDPAAHGGDASDAFDVIVPSLPGFGFSEAPAEPGWAPHRIADLIAGLMSSRLNHASYGVHGGDWGSDIAEQLARRHGASTVGLHVTDLFRGSFATLDLPGLTAEDREYQGALRRWQAEEGGYHHIQATRPQSLAYGLTDSPVGLAGWLIEKWRAWSDCDGDIERRFTKDELLTHITLYWVTGTINSANRLYYEATHHGLEAPREPLSVPVGVATFAHDFPPPPPTLVNRFYDVRRWSRFDRGGHFAALEEPASLADDLREFFRPLRS